MVDFNSLKTVLFIFFFSQVTCVGFSLFLQTVLSFCICNW